MCNKTIILLLRLCYILICNKKEADVINCYVAIQDFMKAQVSRLFETCAITVFRKLKVGPLNGILITKAGSPSHLPPQQFSSFSKIVFNFSFESKITKILYQLRIHSSTYDLRKYHPRIFKRCSAKQLLRKLFWRQVTILIEEFIFRKFQQLRPVDLSRERISIRMFY